MKEEIECTQKKVRKNRVLMCLLNKKASYAIRSTLHSIP